MSLKPFPSWHRSTLPYPLTPLVGRTLNAEHVESLLRTAGHRLVTLTGPGGVGKTRLALHLAMELTDDFVDGVVFVPLSPIRDPALVLPTIGQALDIRDVVDGTFDQRLADLLGDQHLLLVLDNFEQVMPAAVSIARILSACPYLTFLITSQSPLGIEGEQQVPVPPLATPGIADTTTEEILRFDAVELFLQRARAVSPHLVLDDEQAAIIATICRKLDGLPLAIELAAARTNILSPKALLARLSNRLQVLTGDRRDVPDRLQTMRQAIAWSYDLLIPSEQALFRWLSVFVGGVPIEAVEAMAIPVEAAGLAPLDLLGHLVDRSLMRSELSASGDPRFLMLESLREFGLEQLQLQREEEDARAFHAEYFGQLAEESVPHLAGPGQEVWLGRLAADWDNLRAALEWSLSSGHEGIALRICGSIWRFWSTRGLATEGRSWIQQTLDVTESDRTRHRVEALFGAGYLAEDQNDLDVALDWFQSSLDLAEEIGDVKGAAMALIGLGTVHTDRQGYARVLQLQTRAKAIAEDAGERRIAGVALGNMGAVHYYQGRYKESEECWEQCRTIVASLHDVQGEALITSNLGALALDRGDLERAQQILGQSLTLQRRLGDKRSVAFTLTNLGEVWFRLDNHMLADELYAEAAGLFRESGDPRSEAVVLTSVARLALAQEECAKAATVLSESTQTLATLGDATSGVENVELLANLACHCQAFSEAAELYGAAESIRREIEAPTRLSLHAENAEGIATAKRMMGEIPFVEAFQRGRQLDFQAAAERVSTIARRLVARAKSPSQTAGDVLSDPHHLTERERDVLRLLLAGQSTREIAATLYISPRTASTHVTNILGKLGVTSRAAAVAHALRIGIV